MNTVALKNPATSSAKPSLLTRARIPTSALRTWRAQSIKHAGLARCLELIQPHRLAQLKLSDLERVAGLKRRGLHKAFIAHLQCSPGVLLRWARLEYACELLTHTALPVATIAHRSGYRNANSLCVVFMRDLAVSPSQFRSQQQLVTSRGLTPLNTSRQSEPHFALWQWFDAGTGVFVPPPIQTAPAADLMNEQHADTAV